MSTIFISHSSHDRDHAQELCQQLKTRGYDSLFLDFDPDKGIPPGRDWHREIYGALRRSQAVLFLCSPASLASYWCFAELAEARAAGKSLFPLQVAPLTEEARQRPLMKIVDQIQMIDLTADRDAGYTRLQNGLKLAELDDSFPYNPARPPYPGMMSFAEDDAGIYFGREAEVRELIEHLGSMQRLREPLLTMVLGGSGCGKSSLVRAGLVPRLRRYRARWLVVPAFRPRQQPRDELARALADALATAGAPNPDWKRIRDAIGDAVSDRAAAALVELANDLRMTAKAGAAPEGREASVLLVIDQFEELFAESVQQEAGQFLTLLRTALGRSDSPLLVVATMRSEFLGQLQARPELSGFFFESTFKSYPLGPMATDAFRNVITGPAKQADIEIEPRLVERMIDDMESDDTLPLLAFTLRQLYERTTTLDNVPGPSTRRFTERDYAEIGGVKGAVKKCVEDALAGSQATVKSSEAALRVAFLDYLGRLSEDNQFTRQPVRWSDIPRAAHPVLRRLEQVYLLVSSSEDGAEIVEVAHEALFRVWPKLAQWIDADREFLFWRKRFRLAFTDWSADHSQLLTGPLLGQARRRLRERPERFTAPEKSFIRASQRRRWLRMAAATSIVLVVAAAAYEVRHVTIRRDSLLARAEEPAENVRHAAQVVQAPQALWPLLSRNAAFNELRASLPRVHARDVVHLDGTSEKPEQVTVTAFTPDGALAVVAGSAPTARVWQMTDDAIGGRDLATLPVTPNVLSASFSADGRRLVIADRKTVGVWDLTASPPRLADQRPSGVRADVCRGSRIATEDTNGRVHVWTIGGSDRVLSESARHVAQYWDRLVFSADCSQLAVASDDGLRVWDVDNATSVQMSGDVVGRAIGQLHFSPDGRVLLMVLPRHDGSEVLHWDTASGALGKPLEGSGEFIDAAANPDATRVAAISQNRLYIWATATGARTDETVAASLVALAFSPGGLWIATGSADHSVQLWSADGDNVASSLHGHTQPVDTLRFSPDGRFLLSGGRDGDARLWQIGWDESPLRRVQDDVTTQAVSPRAAETLVATGALDGSVRLWGLDTASWELFKHAGKVTQVSFSANGAFLVSASEDGTARVWKRNEDHSPDGQWQAVGKELDHSGANVTSATVGNAGTLVVTAPDSEPPRLWWRDATDAWQFLSLGTVRAQLVALSPQDQWVAVVTKEGVAIGAPTVRKPLEPLSGLGGDIKAMTFSADGTLLLAAGDAGAVLWDVATRQRRGELKQSSQVSSAAFSRDGRLIVTAEGNQVYVWDAATGEKRVTLTDKPAEVSRPPDVFAAVLDGRGRYLIAATRDNRADIYEWPAFAPEPALLDEVNHLGIDVPPMGWRDWLW